ncbi:MAG: hypothetical protein AAGA65_29565 [Actinomycetota bacterium]
MSSCVCGAESEGHARFCWSCGRPVGDRGEFGGSDGLDGLDTVLTGDAGRVVDSSVVRGGASDSRGLAVVVGLLAVLSLALLWGTSRGEPVESADDPDQEAAPRTTTTMGPTTTATTPTTERPTTTRALTVQEVATNLEGPFGYDLLISTVGRPARLDLDAGTVSVAEGSRVFPRFVWGSWLIVAFGEDMARLPLDELGADPDPLVDAEGAWNMHIASARSVVMETGQMWIGVLSGADEPTETLYLVDIESGQVLDEREPSDETYEIVHAHSTGLITAPSGGVYRVTGETRRRVTDGRVLLSDGGRALMQTCDDNFVCSLNWLDTDTWEPLDLVVPADQGGYHEAIVGTDWIFTPNLSSYSLPDSGELLNIATGEIVGVDIPEITYPGRWSIPAVSPDGRWLATRGEDTAILELRDLVDGDIVQIELEERIAGPMFFISD